MDLADSVTSEYEVQRQRPKKGLGKVIGALAATLVVVGLLLVHVWSRHSVLELGYQLSELSSEREALLEEQRRLRIEFRVLTRSDLIAPIGHNDLGLIEPRFDQILYIRATDLPMPSFPSIETRSVSAPPMGEDAVVGALELPAGVRHD
ncbi:MAG: hypothetical protein AUK47_06950 [Deltaproteobacteria bacterium CG2_30_63_29]|nr:MAG: hypothetical protein AUK47_06950 [Deltaproteobacteria bacterium CG2_30_63_29]PJB34071.1 MAG: hypothetical protein CO108_29260 [Deltaproteobacteria bacterium CG_4_9_14_3_um_filter_63_12]